MTNSARPTPAFSPFMLENIHSSDDFLSNEIRNELPEEKRVPGAQLKKAELALMTRLDNLSDTGINPSLKSRSSMRPWWTAAAAVVLLAAGGIWLLFFRTVNQEISTPYGQMGRQVLPDGTAVLLNANSRLVAEGDWNNSGTRKVLIKGEAFLQVSKTTSHSPFIVQTDHLTIEVLGTEFNVVNRNGHESVFLKEGRIKAGLCDGTSIMMRPRDFLTLEGGKPMLKPVAADSLTAWQQQKLIFDKTPLKAVKRILEDQYGVHVSLTPAIEDSMITAIVPNDNLDVLLRALKATSDYDVVRDRDSIRITDR